MKDKSTSNIGVSVFELLYFVKIDSQKIVSNWVKFAFPFQEGKFIEGI